MKLKDLVGHHHLKFYPNWVEIGSALQGKVAEGVWAEYHVEGPDSIILDKVIIPGIGNVIKELPQSVTRNLLEQIRTHILSIGAGA